LYILCFTYKVFITGLDWKYPADITRVKKKLGDPRNGVTEKVQEVRKVVLKSPHKY
jgi:hypothetical protein